MNEKNMNTAFINNKEVATMPTTELVEHERVSYVKELEEYLADLKEMSDSEAKRKSHFNLVKSKIIQENGEFTEQYKYSRRFTNL